MKYFFAVTIAALFLLTPALSSAHGIGVGSSRVTGVSRGTRGFGYGGYGFTRFGYTGFGYGYGLGYGYGASYYTPAAFGYTYPYATLVVPQVTQEIIYVLPAVVPAQVVTPAVYTPPAELAPAVSTQPAPPCMPYAATGNYTAPAVTAGVCPTAAVAAQEIAAGYLTAPTLAYLQTLAPYARYVTLNHFYGAYADTFHFRHFGRVPAGFRGRFRAGASVKAVEKNKSKTKSKAKSRVR